MENRLIPLLIAILFVTALASGCGEKASSRVPAETTATTPATTVPAAAPPETTLPADTLSPTPTAPPEPFPGALTLGAPYGYGREDIAMEVTVYKVRVVDEYEFWSPNWGKYGTTTPGKGNHFLFALVRLTDRGTARARLPSPFMFVLHGDGNSYIETTDRDNSLWIKGINVKQYEYYYEDRAGWIDPGESNRVEGFLLYEVPESLTPDHAHLGITFSSKAAAVWKLG